MTKSEKLAQKAERYFQAGRYLVAAEAMHAAMDAALRFSDEHYEYETRMKFFERLAEGQKTAQELSRPSQECEGSRTVLR